MKVPYQKVGRYKLRGTTSHRKTFGSVSVLPPTLGRIPNYLKDQGYTSYCTAAARSAAGSYFFGRDMSFEFMTAKEGQVLGQPIFNGTDPDTADKAVMEYGFLPTEQCPLNFIRDGWIKPAQWELYPRELDWQAIGNTAVPYNVYPDYQSIKEALVAGKEDNAVVIANGFWYPEWQNIPTGIAPIPKNSPITRHCYIFIDYKTFPDGKERLVAQLSQGLGLGEGGLVYMDEETVNTAFAHPTINGIGCEIFRKGAPNPIQTQISLMQRAIMLLGQLYDKLRGL